MSHTLTVKSGRGRLGRGVKPWAKTVTAVEKNANSGRDWTGDWLTQGTEAEVEIGDMVVVSDLDGEGACIYVASPAVTWSESESAPKPVVGWWLVDCDGSKKWGAALAAEVRRWLSLSVDDRVAKVAQERQGKIREMVAKIGDRAEDTESEWKSNGTPIKVAEARRRYKAMLAYGSTPTDPRGEAIEKIKSLMAQHGIIVVDLS